MKLTSKIIKQIEGALEHAKTKHPLFCHYLAYREGRSFNARMAKLCATEESARNHLRLTANAECVTAINVLGSEVAELNVALAMFQHATDSPTPDQGANREAAAKRVREEALDNIAVLLRIIELTGAEVIPPTR